MAATRTATIGLAIRRIRDDERTNDRGEVRVTADNRVLTVRGQKNNERKEGDDESRYHLVERTYGSFTRSFQLPQGLDESKIEADCEHGILSIKIPKAALPQPRKIQIG